MADDLGTLTVQGDLRSVRYTRVIDASPEELWDALTNPERIARWMLTEEMVLEPRVGGKSHFGWGKQGSADGTVTVYDPPRCLEYTWEEESGTSTVRFEISEVASGVELVLFHRDLAPKVAADPAYQNAKENTPHTARMAHDQALAKVMQHLLKDDTQVYKQFVENESFCRFVGDMVYQITSQLPAQ